MSFIVLQKFSNDFFFSSFAFFSSSISSSSLKPSLVADTSFLLSYFFNCPTAYSSRGEDGYVDLKTDIDQNGYADLEKQMLILHDHEEKHFMSSEIVRDVILGVSDGLTIPFALAAGLSGVDFSSSIILIAGIAKVNIGAISMGLGGYLAATSEADHYKKELKREQDEIIAVPDTVRGSSGFTPYSSNLNKWSRSVLIDVIHGEFFKSEKMLCTSNSVEGALHIEFRQRCSAHRLHFWLE
ncbi:hypothetical protein COP1_006591 [Malus domestica]